jgi:hypothetical protein
MIVSQNVGTCGKVNKTFLFSFVFYTYTCTVKPVYTEHPMEHENVAFMSSCPLYTG